MDEGRGCGVKHGRKQNCAGEKENANSWWWVVEVWIQPDKSSVKGDSYKAIGDATIIVDKPGW